MSDTPNYRGGSPNSCGFTEAEIEARAVSKSSKLWKIQCLNGTAHKNDDSHASAFYYPESGWYGCNVCGVQGFATDRLVSVNQNHVNSGSSSQKGRRRRSFRPDRIPTDATLTSTHEYKRVDGSTIHRVKRYDWIETQSDGTKQDRKAYLPEHLSTDRWETGAGSVKWEPYNAYAANRSRVVYVVEGEKCADALQSVVANDGAVLTSAFGSDAARRTDWSPLRKRISNNGCEIVFVPDRDEPGEAYVQSVAQLLHLEKINVIRIGEPSRSDGYDVADWLAEGNAWDDRPKPIELSVERVGKRGSTRQQALDPLGNGKPQRIRESAYDREIGNLTVDERIERNRRIEPERIRWLIDQYVAAGQTTIIFGKSGRGKTTIVRSLVRHIVEGTDPFIPYVRNPSDQVQRGRALWWLGEEDVALTKPKFLAAELKLDDLDMLDRGHKWRCDDVIEVNSDGSREVVEVSPHTQLLNRIDEAAAEGRPYRVIVVDPLSTMIGETNKAEIFERRWDETVVTLESRGIAVIGIMHPRKDDPINSPLEASLRGTERLFSLPRLVAHVQAETTKEILRQSKEFNDGVTHANPIRDRFNATGNGELNEDRGSIGVLSPLKNSHVQPERLLAWQYSLVNVICGDGAEENSGEEVETNGEDEEGDGVAEFTTIPWRPGDFDLRDRDGKSFGSAVASKYELVRREKQTKQEQLAAVQLEDQFVETASCNEFLNALFDGTSEWTTQDFRKAIEDQGYSYNSGSFLRARSKIALFNPMKQVWTRKTADRRA